MNKEQKYNIYGFIGGIKELLSKEDFKGALILIDDLKICVLELQYYQNSSK